MQDRSVALRSTAVLAPEPVAAQYVETQAGGNRVTHGPTGAMRISPVVAIPTGGKKLFESESDSAITPVAIEGGWPVAVSIPCEQA